MKPKELKSISLFGRAPAKRSDLKVNPNRTKTPQRLALYNGAGSTFDLAGSKVKLVGFGSIDSDFSRVARDFAAVGDDLRTVILADFKAISTK